MVFCYWLELGVIMRQSLLVLLVILVYLSAFSRAFANWQTQIELAVGADENINRAVMDKNKVEQQFVYASGLASYNFNRQMDSQFTLTALLSAQQFEQISGLDNYQLGVELAYSWQNQFGFLAPFFQLSTKFVNQSYDSTGRSNQQISAQFNVTKRLTHLITLTSGYEFMSKSADHQVFDQQQHRLFVFSDYDISKRWLGYLSANYILGDITSVIPKHSTDNNNSDSYGQYSIEQMATVKWNDPAFSQWLSQYWYAYRLADATTLTLTAGINYQLFQNISGELAYTLANSEVRQGISYDTSVWQLTFVSYF